MAWLRIHQDSPESFHRNTPNIRLPGVSSGSPQARLPPGSVPSWKDTQGCQQVHRSPGQAGRHEAERPHAFLGPPGLRLGARAGFGQPPGISGGARRPGGGPLGSLLSTALKLAGLGVHLLAVGLVSRGVSRRGDAGVAIEAGR